MSLKRLPRALAGLRAGELGCLSLALPLLPLLALTLLCSAAQKPGLELSDFYFSPAGQSGTRQTDYAYPADGAIDGVAILQADGFSGELKLDLYLVVFDSDEQVVAKQRLKESVKAGSYTFVFPAILDARQSFGERSLSGKLQAALKGGGTDSAECSLSLSGPDPPEVDFLDLQLYNPAYGKDSTDFGPGDIFVFEALFDIRNNPGQVAPRVMVYAMTEEDSFQVDPELEYQPYDLQWDVLQCGQAAGEFRLRAAGRMPRFYAEPWEHRHPVRVYILVNFPGAKARSDYTRAEVFDAYPGENRRSDDLQQRLVELDRAYKWELRRVKPEPPAT